ncbi:DNA primase family protein [Haloarchaeobius salinus]|uniref:DNA primase family protein n=1 Tax=Haloarchaeobius salinus TaxID=1198298 RepID=UPI00210C4EAC|nr:phage/plasmid primase, P4 family [Haloarchaeobius salinus]
MTDETSAEDDHDEPERNALRIQWEAERESLSNNAQRAYTGWELIREQEDLLAVRETSELYACHDGVWHDDGEQVLREKAREMMTSDYSTALFRELKGQVHATNAVTVSDLGVADGTVAVGNGLLDLRERTLRDLRPDDYALHRLPVKYDPEAGCPCWRAFLEQVVSSESGRNQLQEFVGYCLAGGEPWLKKALMIFGPTDAGKTVFLEVVERLFGNGANAAQTPQYLASERWGVHQLADKPVNIRHDVDAERLQRLGVLKEIIDGNTVTAEQKGRDPYSFKPETRHLFAANRAPKRPVDDEAFWNRWLTIVFPESVPPEKQTPKTELLDGLMEELPGVLNWALDGLDRLRENDGFTDAPSPDEVRRRWEQFGSPVERFKYTRLVKDPDVVEPKRRVQEEFTMFCLDNGYEDLSDQELTRELTKDPAIGQSQRRVDGDRPRVYTGVCLAGDERGGSADSDDGDGEEPDSESGGLSGFV